MTQLRPFRNSDVPALTALWNRGVAGPEVATPLRPHEFESQVLSRPNFDRLGLTVAERGDRLVGFAHAAFGADTDDPAPLRLSTAVGTIAMLVVEPGPIDAVLESALMAASQDYLRARGAVVIYAGGQDPVNPFYWGIYGGSEWAGVVASHEAFHRAALRAGFEPVSATALLEADLGEPEPRDARGVLVRRHTRVEVTEDVLPARWWETLAIGDFRPTLYRLLLRTSEIEVARATTWDMDWYGRLDGRARVGLSDMEVEGASRRKGYGRFLVAEVFRHARADGAAVVAVQTRATNAPALALYATAGFRPVSTATLYRLPG